MASRIQPSTSTYTYDVLIVGAGPAGLGCAAALKECGIENLALVDRRGVGASFEAWPEQMRMISPSFHSNPFAQPDLNAITPHTSPADYLHSEHPSGPEYARYLRAIAEYYQIEVKTGIEITGVEKREDSLELQGSSVPLQARHVIWTGGEFFFPRVEVRGSEHCIHNSTFADWSKLEGVEHGVCTESIYRHIFSTAGRRAGLPKLLPQRKSRRGRRARNGRRAPSIPNRKPISQRPKSAEDRQEFGHWEGDLMHFRRQRDILLTLQERSTRLTLARRLHSKDAPATAATIVEELGGLPREALRTITHDNGGEFARHETVKARIGLTAYFCDPHSPWQRGGIENGNGLVRRDLPRAVSLSEYNDTDIDEIVWMLNSTPRKCLGFQTPIEAFAQQLGVALGIGI